MARNTRPPAPAKFNSAAINSDQAQPRISFSTKATTAQPTSASHPVINRTAAPAPNPSISASAMPAFFPSNTTSWRKLSSQPRTESMSACMVAAIEGGEALAYSGDLSTAETLVHEQRNQN